MTASQGGEFGKPGPLRNFNVRRPAEVRMEWWQVTLGVLVIGSIIGTILNTA